MALPQESQGLCEALRKSHGLAVHFTGVGKVKATFAAQKFIAQVRPDWVLNLGTAGSHRVPVHSLVECEKYIQRDSLFTEFGQKILSSNALTDLPKIICGTADFVEKKERTDCDIYDMEAYAIAFVCEQMNLPFYSIKYVTDSSGENVVSEWKENLKHASVVLAHQVEKLFA